jgi:hypothetical protein
LPGGIGTNSQRQHQGNCRMKIVNDYCGADRSFMGSAKRCKPTCG